MFKTSGIDSDFSWVFKNFVVMRDMNTSNIEVYRVDHNVRDMVKTEFN